MPGDDLILELNARPGLNIQIANRQGLCQRLDAVDGLGAVDPVAEKRVEWACKSFGEPESDLLTQIPDPLDLN